MAVTATPIFVQTVKTLGIVLISTANTNRDGSGTIGTVCSAGANGTKVERITALATGATTAGVVRLFIHNGSASFLWKELLVQAITPSASVAVWSYELDCSQPENCLFLQSTYSLRASTHNAESFNVLCWGGDY